MNLDPDDAIAISDLLADADDIIRVPKGVAANAA
jgi:hypothetical protein